MAHVENNGNAELPLYKNNHNDRNENEASRLSYVARAKAFAQLAIVGFEVGPFNEAARYSLFGTALATTGNPAVAAVAYGASTLAIEGTAALATAPLLASDKADSFINSSSKKLSKTGIKPQDVLNPVTQAGVAIYGGSSISMALNKLKDPATTKEKNRAYGLKVSAALGAICTTEGLLIGEGIAHPNAGTIGAAAVAIGGLAAVGRMVKKRFNHKENDENVEMSEQSKLDSVEQAHPEAFSAKYNLSEKELSTLETAMVSYVEERQESPGISALWITPTHTFSNFVRTHEASYFPEVAEVSDGDEDNTVFLALVDTRESSKRVVHGATLMRPKTPHNGEETSTTGFYTIDSLIERDNFSQEEFYEYYANKGVDVTKCLSVETNFRIGEKPEALNGLKPADIAYVALFQKLIASQPKKGESLIIATINERQSQSFDRIGLKHEPILGRTDLSTEESELGIDSQPVTIICDQYVHDLFNGMNAMLSHMNVE